jgi:hypothetical protein
MANKHPKPRVPGPDGKFIRHTIGFPEKHIENLTNKEIANTAREAIRQKFLIRIKNESKS